MGVTNQRKITRIRTNPVFFVVSLSFETDIWTVNGIKLIQIPADGVFNIYRTAWCTHAHTYSTRFLILLFFYLCSVDSLYRSAPEAQYSFLILCFFIYFPVFIYIYIYICVVRRSLWKTKNVNVLLCSMPHFGVLKYACVLYHLGLVLYREF